MKSRVFVVLALLCLGWNVAALAQTEYLILADRPAAPSMSWTPQPERIIFPSCGRGAFPNTFAVSPNGRLAFVSNFGEDFMSVLDFTLQGRTSEAFRIRNIHAHSQAFTADGSKKVVPLWLGAQPNSDRVVVVDPATLQIVQTVNLNGRVGDSASNVNDILTASIVVVGNRAYLNPLGSVPSGVTCANPALGCGLPIIVVDLDTVVDPDHGGVSTVFDTFAGLAGQDFGHGIVTNSIAATPDGAFVLAVRQPSTQCGFATAADAWQHADHHHYRHVLEPATLDDRAADPAMNMRPAPIRTIYLCD